MHNVNSPLTSEGPHVLYRFPEDCRISKSENGNRHAHPKRVARCKHLRGKTAQVPEGHASWICLRSTQPWTSRWYSSRDVCRSRSSKNAWDGAGGGWQRRGGQRTWRVECNPRRSFNAVHTKTLHSQTPLRIPRTTNNGYEG